MTDGSSFPWRLSPLVAMFAPSLEDELRRVVPLIAKELGRDPQPILAELLRAPAAAKFVADLLQLRARPKKRGRRPLSDRQMEIAQTTESLRAQGLPENAIYKQAQAKLARTGKKPSIKTIARNDKRVRQAESGS